MERPKETYIGDGVYASYDGYYIWLRAPREQGDHEIGLERPVLEALIRYAKRITGEDD
jgi:hypothetical protein